MIIYFHLVNILLVLYISYRISLKLKLYSFFENISNNEVCGWNTYSIYEWICEEIIIFVKRVVKKQCLELPKKVFVKLEC
jgi:hypothetical protein